MTCGNCLTLDGRNIPHNSEWVWQVFSIVVPANGKSAQVVIPSFEKVSALKFKKHERFIANPDNVFALCFALFCFEICFRAQVILSGVKIVKNHSARARSTMTASVSPPSSILKAP